MFYCFIIVIKDSKTSLLYFDIPTFLLKCLLAKLAEEETNEKVTELSVNKPPGTKTKKEYIFGCQLSGLSGTVWCSFEALPGHRQQDPY